MTLTLTHKQTNMRGVLLCGALLALQGLLTCAQSVRLISMSGVRAGVGEVEVQINGTWGVVRGIEDDAATVICKELGWATGVAAAGHTFRAPTGKAVLVESPWCRGNEASILSCQAYGQAVGAPKDDTDSSYEGMTVACAAKGGE